MLYHPGQTAPTAARFRCSGTATRPCLRAIVLAEGQVLPRCRLCGGDDSVWFMVERYPARVGAERPQHMASRPRSSLNRSLVGA
jgi:hypothetical protein